MPMYNLIEYSDKPDKASFKYKQKITSQIGSGRKKDVQMKISLKYLSNFGN